MMLIFVGLLLFGPSICAATDVSRIELIQADGSHVYRNVYDPDSKLKELVEKVHPIYGGGPIDTSGKIASEEIHDYIVSLQKRFPELPQIPIIVRVEHVNIHVGMSPLFFWRYTTQEKHCYRCIPEYYGGGNFMYLDIAVTSDTLDIEAKRRLGHQLGHIAYAKTHVQDYLLKHKRSFEAHDQVRWARLRQWAIFVVSGAYLYNETSHGNFYSGLSKVLVGPLLVGALCDWYVSAKGYVKRCQEEEFYCDKFSLNTAQNDAEKHAMVQSAKLNLKGSSLWQKVDGLLFVSAYPTKTERIAALEKELPVIDQ